MTAHSLNATFMAKTLPFHDRLIVALSAWVGVAKSGIAPKFEGRLTIATQRPSIPSIAGLAERSYNTS